MFCRFLASSDHRGRDDARAQPHRNASGLHADHASARERYFVCKTMACAFGATTLLSVMASPEIGD
jgi:hypothetical protein